MPCWLIELRIVEANQLEEHQALMSSTDLAINTNPESMREQIVREVKANIIYKIVVTYVFIVTLVHSKPCESTLLCANIQHYSLSSHQLQQPSSLLTLGFRHFCSAPPTFSSSASVIYFGGTSVPFPLFSSHWLLGLSLAHTLFISLFIACNIQLPSNPTTLFLINSESRSSPLINSNLLFFFILFTFGSQTDTF
jgi:hypothetical protein